MLLQAGLFDDSPRSRDVAYNMMRLRALRMEVDVKLALGQLTLDQAADSLATTVPMERVTDFLFANGYVPVSLLRWEYLGLRDEVDALERLR